MDDTAPKRLIEVLAEMQRQYGSVYRDMISAAGGQHRLVEHDMAGYENRHEAMQQARQRGVDEMHRLDGLAAEVLMAPPHQMLYADAQRVVREHCERIAAFGPHEPAKVGPRATARANLVPDWSHP